MHCSCPINSALGAGLKKKKKKKKKEREKTHKHERAKRENAESKPHLKIQKHTAVGKLEKY